eukprot:787827-Prorocentrum_minimum.AAC.5
MATEGRFTEVRTGFCGEGVSVAAAIWASISDRAPTFLSREARQSSCWFSPPSLPLVCSTSSLSTSTAAQHRCSSSCTRCECLSSSANRAASSRAAELAPSGAGAGAGAGAGEGAGVDQPWLSLSVAEPMLLDLGFDPNVSGFG